MESSRKSPEAQRALQLHLALHSTAESILLHQTQSPATVRGLSSNVPPLPSILLAHQHRNAWLPGSLPPLFDLVFQLIRPVTSTIVTQGPLPRRRSLPLYTIRQRGTFPFNPGAKLEMQLESIFCKIECAVDGRNRVVRDSAVAIDMCRESGVGMWRAVGFVELQALSPRVRNADS